MNESRGSALLGEALLGAIRQAVREEYQVLQNRQMTEMGMNYSPQSKQASVGIYRPLR